MMALILALAGLSNFKMISDKFNKSLFSILATVFFVAIAPTVYAEKGVYMTAQDFLSRTFDLSAAQEQDLSAEGIKQNKIWLNDELRQGIQNILHHKYPSLRVRYWTHEKRTAWILDEIGKVHPITFGVSIENGRILEIAVLEFRESRGGEIRHPFFTKQFTNASLDQRKNTATLTNSIDGITGATLSVRAAKKVATLALYFHQQIEFDDRQNEKLSSTREHSLSE